MTKTLVLATNNQGKLKELAPLLTDFTLLSQSQFRVPNVAETGLTFVENAIIKARQAARFCPHAVLADDSGLVIDALKGEPGLYSARYAGSNATDAQNIAKVLQAMSDLEMPEQRRAYFICVLVVMRGEWDPCPVVAQGIWQGLILLKEQGQGGFGYDPIFSLDGKTSIAQLTLAQKNSLSHRAQAIAQLQKQLSVLFID